MDLICTDCRIKIEREDSQWRCPGCNRIFKYNEGILSFLSAEETFNQGNFQDKQQQAWTDTAQLRQRIKESRFLSLLNFLRINLSLSGRRDRVFISELKHAKPDAVILDVGCGGGRHYLRDFGRVVGIDPVVDLLREANQIYNEVYQASAFHLPFPDESFDYVVSSDVIGHIPVERKLPMFREMYRVLRKGGRTIHVIETDATSVWFRFAHQFPDLFEKVFVDRPGHFGLEYPTQVRSRFVEIGFRPVLFKKISSSVLESGCIAGWFGNEYKDKSQMIRALVAVDSFLSANFIVRQLLNFILEPLAAFDNYFSPLDHGHGLLVVFEKSTPGS